MKLNNDIFKANNERSNDLKINGYYYDDKAIVYELNGILDGYNSQDYSTLIEKSVNENKGIKHVILDFSNLTYCISVGAGNTTHILKKMGEAGITLHLYNLNVKITEVFKLLGFYSMFSIIFDFQEIYNFKESLFPTTVNCLRCDIKLRILKPGTFKCSSCQQVLIVDDNKNIELGEI